MKTVPYTAALATFVAIVFAFAMTPAGAQMSPGAMGQAEKEFSAPAQTGSSQQQELERRKQELEKERLKMEKSRALEGEFSGPAASGQSQQKVGEREMKPGMMRETKQEAGKTGMGEMKPGMMGGTGREAGKVPATRVPAEGKAGVTERGAVGVGERGAAASGQAPGATAGVAVVVGVDRPDNCLRIRSGPGASHDIIACVPAGESLNLTGVFSQDGRWAQLDTNGWVFFGQLKSDVMPPQAATAGRSFDRPAGAGAGSGKKGYHYYGGCGYSYWPGYFYGPGYYHHRGFRRGSGMYWYPGYY